MANTEHSSEALPLANLSLDTSNSIPPPITRPGGRFYCPAPQCAEHGGFSVLRYYIKHRETSGAHANDQLYFPCPRLDCQSIFTKKAKWLEHCRACGVRENIPSPIIVDGRFYCPSEKCIGHAGFNSRSTYITHIRASFLHAGEATHSYYPCREPGCGRKFTQVASFFQHQFSAHMIQTPETPQAAAAPLHICYKSGCGKWFLSEEELWEHQMAYHEDDFEDLAHER